MMELHIDLELASHIRKEGDTFPSAVNIDRTTESSDVLVRKTKCAFIPEPIVADKVTLNFAIGYVSIGILINVAF